MSDVIYQFAGGGCLFPASVRLGCYGTPTIRNCGLAQLASTFAASRLFLECSDWGKKNRARGHPIAWHIPIAQVAHLYHFGNRRSQILGKFLSPLGDLPDLMLSKILRIGKEWFREKDLSLEWKNLTKIRIAICCCLSYVTNSFSQRATCTFS